MKTPRRSAPASRRSRSKVVKAEAIPAEEVARLEELGERFEASERAWLRMTAPILDEDPWTRVQDHMLEDRGDPHRRWKHFSK